MCDDDRVRDAAFLRRAGLPLVVVSSLSFVAGCATLSDRAKKIVVTNKAQVTDCRFLRVVYGGQKGGLFPKNEALERAADVRATHVVPLYEKGGKYTADAFDCNQSPAVASTDGGDVPPPPPRLEGAPPPAPVAPPPTAPLDPDAPDMSQWVVAVMDVGTVSRKKRGLSRDLMRNISDQLRIFVAQQGVRTIDRGQQDSTFRSQLGSLKADSYNACYDDACQIELGKALAASHILRTRITQFGRLCVLNGELIDLRSEVATAAASSRGDCGEEGFLRMSEEVAVNLVKRR